jgi:hypothetical protein
VPAKPRWLLQIPEIIDSLSRLNAPVVDRATCERLFGLRRRRAIDLMRRFGGYQAGSSMLLDRAALIEALERIAADPCVAAEQQRKARLSAELDKAARCHAAVQVQIPVPADVHNFRVCDLPKGVELQPGQLTVAFADAEQLLASLYELAQAAMNDYDGFRETAEAHRTPG